MFNSDLAIYVKQVDYYEDMSKFAKLGLWVLSALGAEIETIEDLIGEYPSIEVKRELNEKDYKLIDFAKSKNLSYKITNTGIKIG